MKISEVPPVPGWIIRNLINRPFYVRMLAETNIILNNKTLKGFGNCEMMYFKDKLSSEN